MSFGVQIEMSHNQVSEIPISDNILKYPVTCVIFAQFSQGLADNTVIAKVNDVLWDLDRPFEEDASLQLLKFEDSDGKSLTLLIAFLSLFVWILCVCAHMHGCMCVYVHAHVYACLL